MSSPRSPSTPSWTAPLSRELEEVIAKRNLLTARSRSRLLCDLDAAAAEGEEAAQQALRSRAVEELLASERSYLRHLQIVEEFFMRPLQERDWLPRSDFVSIFGDLPSILQVNAELLSCLESSNNRIGKVFLDLAPYLKFYSTYAQVGRLWYLNRLSNYYHVMACFRNLRLLPLWLSVGASATLASSPSWRPRRPVQRCS